MKRAVYEFTRQGRNSRVLITLIAIYATMIAAILWIDAAWWVMGLLTLPTLPALIDYFRNPSAGLRLGQDQIIWHSSKRQATLLLTEIAFMRFDTRWDFSVRVTANLVDGKKLRLPFESLPPHQVLETELSARGIRVERHHFVVF